MTLEVITPERRLYSGLVHSVYVPGIQGEFQILDHHTSIISILKKGTLKLKSPQLEFLDKEFTQLNHEGLYEIPIGGGVIEMNHDHIIILAE